MQEEIRRRRQRGLPPPNPCFEEDEEPNGVYDAHHMQPMYLNGQDQPYNLCARETAEHLLGHRRLDDQRDQADSDPIWRSPATSPEGRLRYHVPGQLYEIDGYE